MNDYQASSNWTGRTPRTSREAFGLSPSEAAGYEYHQAPRTRRFFYACMRHGWIALVAALALSVLTGCGDEAGDYSANQASLADAIAQAAKEQRHAAE